MKAKAKVTGGVNKPLAKPSAKGAGRPFQAKSLKKGGK